MTSTLRYTCKQYKKKKKKKKNNKKKRWTEPIRHSLSLSLWWANQKSCGLRYRELSIKQEVNDTQTSTTSFCNEAQPLPTHKMIVFAR